MVSRVDSDEVTKLNLGGLHIDENPNTQDSAYLKSRVERCRTWMFPLL